MCHSKHKSNFCTSFVNGDINLAHVYEGKLCYTSTFRDLLISVDLGWLVSICAEHS